MQTKAASYLKKMIIKNPITVKQIDFKPVIDAININSNNL